MPKFLKLDKTRMYVVVSYDKILFCSNSKIVKLNLIFILK